jgi:putative transposase
MRDSQFNSQMGICEIHRIQPSFGLLQEPETSGVVERFNRTLKEQAIYGRVFRNLAEVRAAAGAFIESYNER